MKWFVTEWKKTKHKLDLSEAVLRIKSVNDITLPLLGKLIKKVPVRKFLRDYDRALWA
jgi:hypothetical protein